MSARNSKHKKRKSKKRKFVKLLGERWRFQRTNKGLDRENNGETDAPRRRKRAMRIRPKVKDLKELEYVIHEATHAMHWHYDEEHVLAIGKSLGKLLWRCGYRRLPELDEFL